GPPDRRIGHRDRQDHPHGLLNNPSPPGTTDAARPVGDERNRAQEHQESRMHAIVVPAYGDSSVLEYAERPDPVPGPGEVLVDVAATGVNFIDVYHREGRYPLPLPLIPGSETAGTVTAVGPGVTDIVPGDRVGS